MRRRRFTQRERDAVYIASGIESDMEIDHIKPFSAGGTTDVTNAQALSRRANRKKGDRFMELRSWQRDFEAKWESHTSPNFLLVAHPGAGKTIGSMNVASKWLRNGTDRRLVVVVPSNALREDWKADAATFGVELQTVEFTGRGFKEGYDGAVMTFQGLKNNVTLLRHLASKHPTMVISDEHHHCADEKNVFGTSMVAAFELATKRLLLSGTPWRTCNGEEIPYVEYKPDGSVNHDFRYTRQMALNDGVVRYVNFQGHRGRVREALSVSKFDIDSQSPSGALEHLLRAEDQRFIAGIVSQAHDKLLTLRQSIPDAAAMAACIDKRHAAQVSNTIREVTGVNPMVIVSGEEDGGHSKVKQFRNGTSPWVVAVRQISEGTNIPRIQVLAYLTTWSTNLFFTQQVGRAIRKRRGLLDHDAYIYMPSTKELCEAASAMEADDIQVLSERNEREKREASEKAESTSSEVYFSDHRGVEFEQIGSQWFDSRDAEAMHQMASSAGIPVEHVARMWQVEGRVKAMGSEPAQQSDACQPLEDRQRDLRKANEQLVNKIVRMTFKYSDNADKKQKQRAFKKVNKRATEKAIGRFAPVESLSTSQLEARLAVLKGWLQ